MACVATAKWQSQGVQSWNRGGEGKAVLLVGQRTPLLLLLVMDQLGENVDPLLLAVFGAEVTQHDGTEEEAIERHDDEDVEEGIAVRGGAVV